MTGIGYGASLVGGTARGVRSYFSPRDAANLESGMRGAAKAGGDLDASLERSTGSANKLSSSINNLTQNIKQNYKTYMSWAAIGGLVGSALSDLAGDADRVVESYYSMGESMARTRSGMRALIRDTWNLSKMSGNLEMTAARMNMPAEAARGLVDKLLRSSRIFYGLNGKIRKDLLGDTARQILAFSRITGASVDQASDLYARMVNQYGRTHRGAISAMQAVARAGQVVNEELHDVGKDGGVFMEDLVGIINDAAGAFDGFTLNIEHLSARTAHAVKIGQQLGMTYNEAADTAKQMTSIFAKPGGYLAFQAGEQLRQDIEATVAGIADAEERARRLSTKYGINVAQARGLDVASKGANAQMNVMEFMRGTEVGMEKQFALMQEQARNNSMSLDVFKQFVGGENLSAEQSNALMQMLRDQNSTFGDFKRHLDRTKKEATADKVLDNSILVPTMVKEWIKGTSGAMKMNIAAGLGALKFGLLVLAAVKLVSVGMFVYRAVKNLPLMLRNIDNLLVKYLGDGYVQKKELLRAGLREAREKASGAWSYMRSGKMFSDLRGFFVNTRDSLMNLVRMFRTGNAGVTIRGYAAKAMARAEVVGRRTQRRAAVMTGRAAERVRGARDVVADRTRNMREHARAYAGRAADKARNIRDGIVSSGRYQDIRDRAANTATSAADVARMRASATRETLVRERDAARAAFEKVSKKDYGENVPAIVRNRKEALERAQAKLSDFGASRRAEFHAASEKASDLAKSRSSAALESLKAERDAAAERYQKFAHKDTGDTAPLLVKARKDAMLKAQVAYDNAQAQAVKSAAAMQASTASAVARGRAAAASAAAYTASQARSVAAFARNQQGKAAAHMRAAYTETTRVAQDARSQAVSMSRRARRRLAVQMRRQEAAAVRQDAAAGPGAGRSVLGLLGALGGFGGGFGTAGAIADVAMTTADMAGGGYGPEESFAGPQPQAPMSKREKLKNASPAARARLERMQKLRKGSRFSKLKGVASDVHGAVQPVTQPLAKASRWSNFWRGNIKTDALDGLGKAATTQGSLKRRAARGALTAAGSWTARNAAKATTIVGGAAGAYMLYQQLMPNEDTGMDGETQRAGGRKYDEKLQDQEDVLQSLSEQIDIAKLAGDESAAKDFEKEYKVQKDILEAMGKNKDALDAKDRQREEIEGRIEKLKKAKKNARSDHMKDLLDAQIKNLEAQEKQIDTDLAREGLTASSVWERTKSFAKLFTSIAGLREIGGLLLKIGPVAWAANAMKTIAGKAIGFGLRVLSSPIGKIGFVQKAVGSGLGAVGKLVGGFGSKVAAFLGPKAMKFIPGLGDLLVGGIAGATTEGSLGKKLFVGAGTAGASILGRIGGGAAMGAAGAAVGSVAPGVGTAIGGVGGIAVGQGVGSAAAATAAQSYLPSLFDKWFSDNGDGSATQVVRPSSEPAGSMAGGNTSAANTPVTGSFGKLKSDGTVTVEFTGFTQLADQANAKIAKRDSGLSGG